MSHWTPGYWFQYHVPPKSPPRFEDPDVLDARPCLSWAPALRPLKPPPITTTSSVFFDRRPFDESRRHADRRGSFANSPVSSWNCADAVLSAFACPARCGISRGEHPGRRAGSFASVIALMQVTPICDRSIDQARSIRVWRCCTEHPAESRRRGVASESASREEPRSNAARDPPVPGSRERSLDAISCVRAT